ncbi:hypothetical protein MSAN_00180200 [Mycena sanguinolenta]|uniref:DUF6697 domain-containing protein n=1 Tax=Mycena sanguinolenta TaxID=230812 RepID=A0A8H7DKJ5_9AGAR|nr:hypothetical protein MSAN_00180200 [Mycena sanguinolenta]
MAQLRATESDAPTEQKVKVEPTTPGLKVEKVESECSTTPEIAVLKALLKKKEEQALAREIASETKLLALDKENKRLKQKREVDLAKIEALEAEVARLKDPQEIQVKKEDPNRIDLRNKRHAPEEAMVVLDSEDEETEDSHPGEPAMTDVQPSLEATPQSPGPTSPEPSNGQPSRDAWSPLPDATEDPLHNRNSDSSVQTKVKVKEEVIDVVIKKEGEDDQFKRVTLIKSEDGNFDIWNVDGFHLGPTVEVDEKYNRGFTRKVIGDAFGGGPQSCYHHWKRKPGPGDKTPFATFNRSWNNALPTSPGLHGMVFARVRTCPLTPQPVNFFRWRRNQQLALVGNI